MGCWADFEGFLSDLRTRLLTYLWLLWTSMDSLVEPEDLRDPVTQPPWGQIGRNLTLGVVSLAGKFVLQVCNSLDVKGHSRLTQLVMHRPPGTGLITVSNHARSAQVSLSDAHNQIDARHSVLINWCYLMIELLRAAAAGHAFNITNSNESPSTYGCLL